MNGARQALDRLSATRRTRSVDAERLTAFRLDGPHSERVEPPLDYAAADETPPLEARPMFFTCERVLIASLAGIGLLAALLWRLS